MTELNISTEEFENKYNCKVDFLMWHEVSEKYGIDNEEIENLVINKKGTLPQELLVVEKDGKPFIFHARAVHYIENLFLESLCNA